MFYTFFCILLALTSFAKDASPNLKESLIESSASPSPLLNEVISFKPVKNHKFNLEAENKCGQGRTLTLSKSEIKCQAITPGPQTLEVYVCDKQNTYCKKETFEVNVQSPSGFTEWSSYYYQKAKLKLFNTAPKLPKQKSPNSVAKGFIQNNIEKAIGIAKKENKPILLFYTQLYCPPCRQVKDLTLSLPKFQKATEGFVKLQIDADIDQPDPRLKSFNFRGTPTFMTLTSDFKEISRWVGFISFNNFKHFINTPLTPINNLSQKEVHTLSGNETLRLLKWKLHFKNPDLKPYTDHLSKMKNFKEGKKWVGLANLRSALDKKNSDNSTLELLKTFSKEISLAQCNSYFADHALGNLFPLGYLLEKPNFKKNVFNAIGNMEKNIKANPDNVTCAFQNYYVKLISSYYYESIGEKNLKEKADQEMYNSIAHLKKVSTSKKTSSLDILLAQSKIAKEADKKAYQALKTQNNQDYSYDYWEANQLIRDKKYKEALEACEKALKKAKGVNWQRVTLVKLKALEGLKRTKEAKQVIQEVFATQKLPVNPNSQIHKYMPQLRKKHSELSAKN